MLGISRALGSNAINNIISIYSILLAKGHSNEEYKKVQTAKGVAQDVSMDIQNKHNKGTGDLTASGNNMRRRSRHSNYENLNEENNKDSNNKNKKNQNPNKKSQVKDDSFSSSKLTEKISKISSEEELCRVIRNELTKFKNSEGKYNGIIKIIANPAFLFECYKIIKSKPGNMSPGITPETLDGINIEWFNKAAEDLKTGRYQFKPARQVLIPKAKVNTSRPISISSPRDKIVQKALQLLLGSIYEYYFLHVSHGFRPNKSVHSALDNLHLRGGSYNWVIQGDITQCFDSIPHEVIMKNLKSHICCSRIITLVERTLKIGYVQSDKRRVKNKIGTPQGNILSPLLANIVLHQLDNYIETDLKKIYNIGERRKRNKLYEHYSNLRRYSRIDKVDPKVRSQALKELRQIPRVNVYDPNYKRIMYVRYADDFVILTVSSYKDACVIRDKVKEFLINQCGLTLNLDKSVITNLRKGFNFLGAFCFKKDNSSIFNKSKNQLKVNITRRSTLRLRVDIPIKELVIKLIKFGFARRNYMNNVYAKGISHMIHQDHYTILQFFNSKIRGILNFYSFAGNRSSLHKIFWILRQSCALTLARKLKLRTMRKVFKKFGFDLKDPLTGININIPKSLIRLSDYKLKNSGEIEDVDQILAESWANKLTSSVKLGVCCLCGSSTKIEMHHIRKVNDVRQKMRTGNMTFGEWKGSVLRKQVPLCQYHHDLYHKGLLSYTDLTLISRYAQNLH
jgi:group II intron reverse transcriptase/maturase